MKYYFELTDGESIETGSIEATTDEMVAIQGEIHRLIPHLEFTYMDDPPEVDLVVSDTVTALDIAHDILVDSALIPFGVDLGDFDKEAVHYHEGSHIAHPGIYCPACED